jgi:hypothetical protein
MAAAMIQRERGTPRARRTTVILTKADRPRRIDRYIDYFGDGSSGASAARRTRVATARLMLAG